MIVQMDVVAQIATDFFSFRDHRVVLETVRGVCFSSRVDECQVCNV